MEGSLSTRVISRAWASPPETQGFSLGALRQTRQPVWPFASLQGSGKVTEVSATGVAHLQLCLALHSAMQTPPNALVPTASERVGDLCKVA